MVQYNSWQTGAGIEKTAEKSDRLEEGEEVGDGRAEGPSATGDAGPAATQLTPYADGPHVHIFFFLIFKFFYFTILYWFCHTLT